MLDRNDRCVLRFVALLAVFAAPAIADDGGAIGRPAAGTKDEILYRVGYAEFSPVDSTIAYVDRVTGNGFRGRSSTSAPATFEAHPHLPSGGFLHSIRFDYCVESGSEITLDLLECDLSGNVCNVIVPLTSAGGAPGACTSVAVPDMSGLGYILQNGSHQLILEAHTPGNSHSAVLGVTLGYKLQMSIAPATATFGDVPTSHIYFRAIEALAASGITSGCGGGNFCPNQAVTRGELAKFLANGLGLHWPN